MTGRQAGVVGALVVLMWLVIAFIFWSDVPVTVPADIRPAPSYTPFTQAPRSGGALVGQPSDPSLSGLAP